MRVRLAGCHVPADRRQRMAGERSAVLYVFKPQCPNLIVAGVRRLFDTRACSAAVLFHARRVLNSRGVATLETICSALDAYNGRRRQRD
jgi:hypothetical protein